MNVGVIISLILAKEYTDLSLNHVKIFISNLQKIWLVTSVKFTEKHIFVRNRWRAWKDVLISFLSQLITEIIKIIFITENIIVFNDEKCPYHDEQR